MLPKDQVKAATDLVEIVRESVELHPRGDELVGLCPFHKEETPSFSVNPEKQVFKCFGCGQGGDVFKFVQQTDGSSFEEALRKLASGAGIVLQQNSNGAGASTTNRTSPHRSPADWKTLHERMRSAMTPQLLTALSEATGVPEIGWHALSPGWETADGLRALKAGGAGWTKSYPDGAYVFAERFGDNKIAGLFFRTSDGRKGTPSGSKRGLIVPGTIHELPDPVLVVEGASDVAACIALGLPAVGRPSNRAGAKDLVLLDGREVLVVGERDQKAPDAWPGRDGAKAVATSMASARGKPVGWTLPPSGSKDIRAWLTERRENGRVSAADELAAAGSELLVELQANASAVKPPVEESRPADILYELLHKHYRLLRSLDGEPFAVAKEGWNLAIPLRGGLRGMLGRAYREKTGHVATGSPLTDAMAQAESDAMDPQVAAESVHIRVGTHEDGIALDLGDETGAAVVVSPDAWRVEECSPVLFRRTVLTSMLPVPARGGDIAELRKLLHVSDETWPLVLTWAVATLIPDIYHPILLLGGEQGTGKSTSARLLLGLVDPSNVPLGSEPRDQEAWSVAAAGSWTLCIDNVSRIAPWFSDTLCRVVTGETHIRRRKYTDAELSVLSYKRCVVLTSIDPGALRDDLSDRVLLIDLERIDDAERLAEHELDAAYETAKPRLLGGLLDALSGVLKVLPHVELKYTPRMAGFSRVAAALDLARPDLTGGQALSLYEGQLVRLADDTLQGNPVAVAIIELMRDRTSWSGTSAKLREAIDPRQQNGDGRISVRGWPNSDRGMAATLKRIAPTLRRGEEGLLHTPPKRGDRRRIHTIERVGG